MTSTPTLPPTSPLCIKRKAPNDTNSTTIHPRKCLRIEIPPINIPPPLGAATADDLKSSYSPSSLFSALSHNDSTVNNPTTPDPSTTRSPTPALLTAPPIPGLHFTPALQLPQDLADTILNYCMSTYFHHDPSINQIMLFTRRPGLRSSSPTTTATTPIMTPTATGATTTTTTDLPPILTSLLTTLSTLLLPYLPPPTHALLFPPSTETNTHARQVILNLYTPGEGITSHVDLLNRFGDGIIGISLGSGCVMQFARVVGLEVVNSSCLPGIRAATGDSGTVLDSDSCCPQGSSNSSSSQGKKEEDIYDLYLPERSILVLSSDARYKWTHAIEKRKTDFVSCPPPPLRRSEDDDAGTCNGPSEKQAQAGRWVERGIRLSLTFRWLLPGADIVGSDPASESDLDF